MAAIARGSAQARVAEAVRLSPERRHALVRRFFERHPGSSNRPLGLGLAVFDFQRWEVDSGRVPGSRWWCAVNGLMLLDLRDSLGPDLATSSSVQAWQRYTSSPDQGALWEAHQLSLHRGLRAATELLAAEPPAEQAFAEIVIDVVDRTALAASPTDTADLAGFTELFYPARYPVEPEQLEPLEKLRERTADALRDTEGRRFDDVGVGASRWPDS